MGRRRRTRQSGGGCSTSSVRFARPRSTGNQNNDANDANRANRTWLSQVRFARFASFASLLNSEISSERMKPNNTSRRRYLEFVDDYRHKRLDEKVDADKPKLIAPVEPEGAEK